MHKPWYRTKWGTILAILLLPLWLTWKKSRRIRILRTGYGLFVAVVLFVTIIFIISHFLHSTSNKSPASTNTGSAAATPASSTNLVGYGATQASWNGSHTEDSNFSADTAYNPTSGLGNGYNDKYIGVQWVGGRALSYQVGFPSNTSLASAENSILQEFPSDVTVLWSQQNNSDSVDICYQMEVQSATLAETLGGDGDVFVEFQTITGNDNSNSVGYYANNVNNAVVRNSDYKTPSSVGGC